MSEEEGVRKGNSLSWRHGTLVLLGGVHRPLYRRDDKQTNKRTVCLYLSTIYIFFGRVLLQTALIVAL